MAYFYLYLYLAHGAEEDDLIIDRLMQISDISCCVLQWHRRSCPVRCQPESTRGNHDERGPRKHHTCRWRRLWYV